MLKALIIGISGQDGAYLAKLLLDQGYEVYGTSRGKGSVPHNHIISAEVWKGIACAALAAIFSTIFYVKGRNSSNIRSLLDL